MNYGRTLYDVTQLLESADRADERMRRVLELLRDLVPYEQCALLEARLGHDAARRARARDVGRRAGCSSPARWSTSSGSSSTRTRARCVVPAARGGAPRRAARGARRGDRHLAGAVIGDGIQRGAPARAVGDRGEARRLHHDPGRERRSRGARPRARRGPARRRGGPRREGRARWSWFQSELKTPLRSTGDGAFDELEQKIQAQAQRLDDLLGQARLASAELRLTLRKVAPALAGRGSVVTWRLEAARATGLIETGTRARPAAARPTDAKTSRRSSGASRSRARPRRPPSSPPPPWRVTLPVGSMVQRSVRRSASTSSARSCLLARDVDSALREGLEPRGDLAGEQLVVDHARRGRGERDGGGRRHGRFAGFAAERRARLRFPRARRACRRSARFDWDPARSSRRPGRAPRPREHAATDTTVTDSQSAIFILVLSMAHLQPSQLPPATLNLLTNAIRVRHFLTPAPPSR